MGIFTQEAVKLGTTAAQLAVASGITIGHRLPRFFEAALGFPAAQEEVHKAVVEKMAATAESHIATSFAMMQLGWSMALGGTSQATMRKAANVGHAALESSTRRAKANASRLSGKNGT